MTLFPLITIKKCHYEWHKVLLHMIYEIYRIFLFIFPLFSVALQGDELSDEEGGEAVEEEEDEEVMLAKRLFSKKGG